LLQLCLLLLRDLAEVLLQLLLRLLLMLCQLGTAAADPAAVSRHPVC
jgi:hypothetical protein